MRVLLFTTSYPPQIGGLAVAVKNIATEMVAKGSEVLVLTDSQSSSTSFCIEEIGVITVRTPLALPRVIRNAGGKIFFSSLQRAFISPLTMPNAFITFMKILDQFQPDIVNLHYIGDNAFFCLLARQFIPFKLVVNLHGNDINRYRLKGLLTQKMIRDILRSSERVLSNSQALLDSAIVIEPEVKAKSDVVGNGIFLERFIDREQPLKESYILSLGNLIYRKGVDLLIKAYHILRAEGKETRLVIAGDGPERSSLESLTESLGLKDSVLFVGAVSEEDAPAWFSGCSLFVLPSRMEPFGITLLEAMASRKAIVAAVSGGVPELVQNGVNGILVKPESPEELAVAIKRLLKNEKERFTMGEAGFKRVQENFTWSHVVDRCFDAYETVLQE